jgi:hypothetical protein
MSESTLERVQEDLEVVKQAMGLRRPFEWEHVWACLALGVVGLLIATITAATDIARRPVVAASQSHLAYLGLLLVPAALIMALLVALGSRRRHVAPFFWCESRRSLVVAAVIVPLYLLFAAWAARSTVAAGALTASTLFLAGLFALAGAIADPSRRHVLGFAVSTMLAGLVAPVANYESAGLLAGAWLFLGGSSTAAILAWRLRSTVAHGTD